MTYSVAAALLYLAAFNLNLAFALLHACAHSGTERREAR